MTDSQLFISIVNIRSIFGGYSLIYLFYSAPIVPLSAPTVPYSHPIVNYSVSGFFRLFSADSDISGIKWRFRQNVTFSVISGGDGWWIDCVMMI